MAMLSRDWHCDIAIAGSILYAQEKSQFQKDGRQ